jgi:hypothetical protein
VFRFPKGRVSFYSFFKGKVSFVQTVMLNQLSLLLLTVLACMSFASACQTVLEQNFNQYPGAYQLWTKEMGKTDFPGFKFLKLQTAANSLVGEGQYRSNNPQGNSLSCVPRATVVYPYLICV